MPTSTGDLGALARGKTIEAGVTAAFRKKYGVRGDDGDYHLPLPPKGHPLAKVFARAVLRRAHQTKKLGSSAIARQVRKAKSILGESDHVAQRGLSPRRESNRSVGEKWGTLRESGRFEAKTFSTFFPLLEGPKFDDEKGTARVVLIREGTGNAVDGHYYTAEALKRAVDDGIFEGAKCYIDHPTPIEEKIIPERSADRLGGFYFDVRFEEVEDFKTGEKVKAVTAEFQPQVGDPRVLSLLRTSEQYARRVRENTYFGFSINAMGGGEVAEIDGRRFNRVDEITKVFSVDIVTEAGAGGGPIPGTFRESNRMPHTDLALAINRSKLVEGLASPLRAVRVSAFDTLFESDAVKNLPADAKKALLEARREAEKNDDLEEDDEVVEAINEALEAAVEEAEEDPPKPAREKRGGKRENGTPALEETSPSPDNRHDDTTPAGGFHEAEIDKMDEAGAKAALKKLNAQYGNAKVAERDAVQRANDSDLRLAESRIDNLLESEEVPEQYRPRLRRELLTEGVTKAKEIRERIREFAAAYIEPSNVREGAGGGRIRESGRTGSITVPDFTTAR